MTGNTNIDQAPGLPLREAVETYMLASFNDSKTYYLNYLVNAKLVLKELLRKTITSMKRVEVPVHYDGTRKQYYAIKPKDCSKLFSVSAIVDGVYYPLYRSAEMPVDIEYSTGERKKCSCGGDDLCAVVESKVETREEVINGQAIILRKWNKVLTSGDIVKYEESAVYDESEKKIIKIVKNQTVAQFEKSPCGCVKDTPANTKILYDHCGCYLIGGSPGYSNKYLPNDIGYFSTEELSNLVVFKPATEISHYAKEFPKTLVFSYQTDFSGSDDLIVPDYAMLALFAGITYYSAMNKQSTNRLALRELRRTYLQEKEEMMKYLSPIDMDEFSSLGSIIPLWG